MTIAYLTLYVFAVTLATLGLLIPAIILAVAAHSLAHSHALVRIRPIRVKPIHDIHG